MIAIVHYGVGNVNAIANIYKRLEKPFTLASTPSEIATADRIILPGVGAFDWAMSHLNESGLRPAIEEAVAGRGKPLLGICVGMQMLASSSEEGRLPGLGLIDGVVKRFDTSSATARTLLPHMGWNDVHPCAGSALFQDLPEAARFYFLHSYYFAPAQSESVLATTDYHGSFASSVGRTNVFGVQFHPEKSHGWGIALLRNFAEI